MDLTKEKCKPCEGGTPPMSKIEIAKYKKLIRPDWKVRGNKIKKEYSFADYRHTIEFVNKVADLAEEEGHHPVMHVYYSKVMIELWTHAVNGLSANDFILASKIDK